MLNPKDIYETFKEEKIDFFTGVPDSLLKDICAYITDNTPKENNIIAANEGNAIGIATGYHLATNKVALVYMQNSGLGNTINPLISLADKKVYSIPMLLMIGWRGEPGKKDEPQHMKQGEVTKEILETVGIKYDILSDDIHKARDQIKKANKITIEEQVPYALIIKKDLFEEYKLKNKVKSSNEMKREEALEYILKNLNSNEIIVSTTGKTSREVYEIREKYNQNHEKDFLTVGSMGHTSSIALGINLANNERKIVCIDGDGSFIMHMGAIAIIAQNAKKNFKYIIINNGSHESVGAQPTVGFDIDIPAISKAVGFKNVYSVDTLDKLNEKFNDFINNEKNSVLEIKVKIGAREDLGRPKTTPIENKELFKNYIINK